MAASNRVKTIASTSHSKLSGHSKLNQKRATKVFPASRQHEAQTPHPSLFTTISGIYPTCGALHTCLNTRWLQITPLLSKMESSDLMRFSDWQ